MTRRIPSSGMGGPGQHAARPQPQLSADQKQARREQIKRESDWRKVNAANNKAVAGVIANNKAVAGVIATGKVLIQAQQDLPSGSWKAWVEGNLKWTVRTVDRFQTIGSYAPFQFRDVQKSPPASWGTLYALTKLTADAPTHAIAEGPSARPCPVTRRRRWSSCCTRPSAPSPRTSRARRGYCPGRRGVTALYAAGERR